jgi:hypothetical protein
MAKAASRSALEYHRSHLRYYAKHNAPWQSSLLRASLAGRGALGWLAALGSGSSRAERRRCARALLRLALGRGEAPLPPLR